MKYKKKLWHICKKVVTTVFEFITNNKKHHNVNLMYKVLKVSRSSYYKHLHKKPSKRTLENQKIKKYIIDIYKESRNCYGAIKINKCLKLRCINISIKRTQLLMKSLGIKSIITKKFRPMLNKKKIPEKTNILKRDFSTTSINQKWRRI